MADDVLFSELETQYHQKIGLITLNAEKALNALNQSMINLMLSQLRQWRDDDNIILVFIQGSGEKAFCAGGDVRALRDAVIDAQYDIPKDFFETEYRVDYSIHTFPKPVICWGTGIVMGGGIGLMIGATYRVVTNTSMLAMPEISIGLYPDVAGSWFLSHLPGNLGLFIALTGCRMNAADADYIDIANRFIDHESKDSVIESLQATDWRDSDVYSLVHNVLEKYRQSSSRSKLSSKLREHRDLISELMDQPSLSDIMNAFENLKTEDAWLLSAQKNTLNGSPLSAAISYRQLQKSKHMSLKEVFQSELDLSVNTVINGDFCEGVRSLLVAKDKNPQWRYKKVQQVDKQFLNDLFSSPWIHNPLYNL